MAEYHGVAKCRWCRKRFVQIYGWQWRCESDECFEQCIAHAILLPKPEPNKSPYFFLPLPLQVDTEKAPWKRTLVWGSAGISKSFGARMALYKQCMSIPGTQALLLRCTLDQLKKNHLNFMDAEAKTLGNCKFVSSYPMHMAFDNGSRMFAGYCDDNADIGQHLGPEWDRVLMEEAGFFLPRALSEISARDRGSSTARAAMAERGMKSGRTTNLSNPGGRGWLLLKDFYIDKAPDPDLYPAYEPKWYGSIHGDVEDNPYLEENYRSATLGGLSAARYQQLAHGRADVFEGQFFSDFDPSVHVVTA